MTHALAPFLSLGALLLALPAWAEGERIPSHCIALANAPAPQIQRAALTPPAEGEVLIHYLDHASFAIMAEDGTLAVTDYTGWTGSADLLPDAVTMNNAHGTHWTANPDPRIAHVLRGWATGDQTSADHRLDLGMMLIRNIPTDIRDYAFGGTRFDGNSIFVFEVAGLCIGHLGHLHQVPSPEQFAAIGRMDIVLVPVDGRVTLSISDMAEVVARLRASVVIPMHWFSGEGLQQFTTTLSDRFDVVETGYSSMVFSRRNLPARPTIMVLEPGWLN